MRVDVGKEEAPLDKELAEASSRLLVTGIETLGSRQLKELFEAGSREPANKQILKEQINW